MMIKHSDDHELESISFWSIITFMLRALSPQLEHQRVSFDKPHIVMDKSKEEHLHEALEILRDVKNICLENVFSNKRIGKI
jgi:hypothetical protein